MYDKLLCGVLSRKVLQAAFAFRAHAVPPGKCDYLLDVTPSNPQPHHYHLPLIIQVQGFGC